MWGNIVQSLKEWQTLCVWIAGLIIPFIVWVLRNSPYINFIFIPIPFNFGLLLLTVSSLILLTIIGNNYWHSDWKLKSKTRKVAKDFKNKWNEYSDFMSQYNNFKDQNLLNKYKSYRDWFINNFCILERDLIHYLERKKVGAPEGVIQNIKDCYSCDDLPKQKA